MNLLSLKLCLAQNPRNGQKLWTEEVDNLEKRKTWTVIAQSSVPEGAEIIPSTWAFKCKRFPDGSFRKFKARFCVRGDIQKHKSTEPMNTYAPVVNWSTVRFMLVLTCILDLKTQATDFSNAFAQATLEKPVYLRPPARFRRDSWGSDPILKLNKSLYGQAEAPRLWYEKLSAGLTDRGFTASVVDPCLFISSKVICISYVDDCLWFYRNQKDMDDLLESFRNDGDEYNWEMRVEGSVKEFLGIEVKSHGKGGYKLTQTGLIDKILATTGMSDCNGKPTPTNTDKPLGTDANGKPARYKDKWSYASVVGMLMYLAANSLPEIQFAVHQCARFTHNYKASHEEAILRICRYLKDIKEKGGLVINPSNRMQMDCYVDADFAGLYRYEDAQDPVCAKSRTGFVITFANCPIMWVSKLQQEVALSTLHAEYIALSQSLRELLPLKELAREVLEGAGQDSSKLKVVTKSSVFEDNQGTIQVATCPKMTPTSKFIAVKYHWFRQHISNGNGDPNRMIEIKKIDGKVNPADIFTKSVQGSYGQHFQDLRMILCGW